MLFISFRILGRLAVIGRAALRVIDVINVCIALVDIRGGRRYKLGDILPGKLLPPIMVKVKIEKQAQALIRLGGVQYGSRTIDAARHIVKIYLRIILVHLKEKRRAFHYDDLRRLSFQRLLEIPICNGRRLLGTGHDVACQAGCGIHYLRVPVTVGIAAAEKQHVDRVLRLAQIRIPC